MWGGAGFVYTAPISLPGTLLVDNAGHLATNTLLTLSSYHPNVTVRNAAAILSGGTTIGGLSISRMKKR